jgi:hypothetical protein
MKWNGIELDTVGKVCTALQSLKTQDEADEFMAGMREEGPEHADANIGYIIGYLGAEDRLRLYELLKVKHPIFGDQEPSPEEVLAMGVAMGKKANGN